MSGTVRIKNNNIYAKLLNDNLANSALNMLQNPVWPLCRLTLMLYLTSPYSELKKIIFELPKKIELEDITYDTPVDILTPYLDELSYIEVVKNDNYSRKKLIPKILSEDGQELDLLERVIYFIQQNIIDKELESINSYLCRPMNCTLCCIGPKKDALQEFFEIPLLEKEIGLFALDVIEDDKSIYMTPYDEPPFLIEDKPFYFHPPKIYRWSYGYSLILPKGTKCPNLDTQGRCIIYKRRPVVCRKPQIFSKVIDRDIKVKDSFWQIRKSILAITDCPYVLATKDKIISYANKNELDCVFMQNKI